MSFLLLDTRLCSFGTSNTLNHKHWRYTSDTHFRYTLSLKAYLHISSYIYTSPHCHVRNILEAEELSGAPLAVPKGGRRKSWASQRSWFLDGPHCHRDIWAMSKQCLSLISSSSSSSRRKTLCSSSCSDFELMFWDLFGVYLLRTRLSCFERHTGQQTWKSSGRTPRLTMLT